MKATLIAAATFAALLSGCTDGGGDGLVSPAPEASGGALPESFPVPDGAQETQRRGTGGGGTVAQYTVDAPVGRILGFYETELTENGWRLVATDPTELFTVFRFAGNGWGGSVTVVKGPPTQLAIAINPEPTIGG